MSIGLIAFWNLHILEGIFDNLAMWGRWLNGRCTKIAIVQVLAYQKNLPKFVQGVKINFRTPKSPFSRFPVSVEWRPKFYYPAVNTHQSFYTPPMRTSTRPWCRPVFTQLQRRGLDASVHNWSNQQQKIIIILHEKRKEGRKLKVYMHWARVRTNISIVRQPLDDKDNTYLNARIN